MLTDPRIVAQQGVVMRWIATPNRRKLLVVGAAGLALVPALAFAGQG